MKIVSVILIIAYLLLPALCFGHPCERLSVDSTQSTLACDASGACPLQHDSDDCETTCCCAGHMPLSTVTKIPYAALTSKLVSHESRLALPRVIDRIYVPPQNIS